MKKLIAGTAVALSLLGCKSGDKNTEQPKDPATNKAEKAKCGGCGSTDCACGCDGDPKKCACK